MGRAEHDPRRATPLPAAVRSATYVDAEGRPTDDPEVAVGGEIAEYDAHGHLRRRTRFFLTQKELRWLPVGELAFLLWVLAALMVAWLVIGLVLHLV